MAILRICAADGCNTKTLGSHCIQHETVPGSSPSGLTRGRWPEPARPPSSAVRAALELRGQRRRQRCDDPSRCRLTQFALQARPRAGPPVDERLECSKVSQQARVALLPFGSIIRSWPPAPENDVHHPCPARHILHYRTAAIPGGSAGECQGLRVHLVRTTRRRDGMTITHSVEIARSPEDVFAYIDQVARHPEWQDGLVSTRVVTEGTSRGVEGRGGAEARRTRAGGQLRDHRARPAADLCVSRPRRPDPAERARHDRGGGRRSTSRVTLSLDLTAHGLMGKALLPLARSQAAKQVPRDHERLKERLESGSVYRRGEDSPN